MGPNGGAIGRTITRLEFRSGGKERHRVRKISMEKAAPTMGRPFDPQRAFSLNSSG
jgi:hypothetical protein